MQSAALEEALVGSGPRYLARWWTFGPKDSGPMRFANTSITLLPNASAESVVTAFISVLRGTHGHAKVNQSYCSA